MRLQFDVALAKRSGVFTKALETPLEPPSMAAAHHVRTARRWL